MNEKRNIVECIGRRYRIQSPGGMVVEIESFKPLSKYLNDKLLEEDEEINNFFMDYKILSISRYIVEPKPSEPSEVRPSLEERISVPSLEERISRPSRKERIDVLLKMEGEFTRQDYEKSIENKFGVKIPKSVAHYDLNMIGTKLEHAGRIGRKEKYKIKEKEEVEKTIKGEEVDTAIS